MARNHIPQITQGVEFRDDLRQLPTGA